jgi:Zn-dependent protease
LPGLSFLLVLQISAVLFNLIPVPPFDGYNALEPWLPQAVRAGFERLSGVTIWLVFLLFWYVPTISDSFWSQVFRISTFIGVDWGQVVDGLQRFRFWEL